MSHYLESFGHALTLKLAAVLVFSQLAGCVTQPPTVYQWQDYQPQLYKYFTGADKQAQIDALRSGLDKIHSAGGRVPPGYHAQLGMLYGQTGNPQQMAIEFNAERALFPESAPYIAFLLRNASNTNTNNVNNASNAGTASSASEGKK